MAAVCLPSFCVCSPVSGLCHICELMIKMGGGIELTDNFISLCITLQLHITVHHFASK